MIPKNLELIELADIRTLVEQKVLENRSLEFKRELTLAKDSDKKEFLADVSALANTVGGDLVFGVEQREGIAHGLTPLSISNPDSEQQRIEAIIRSGLDPRLPSVLFKWVKVDSGFLLVIRVPKSFAAPHRVIFQDHSKFYLRGGSGKYAMDVSELRTAFNAGATLTETIRSFRRQRYDLIQNGEGAVALEDGLILVFHILPVSAFVNPLSISPHTDRDFFIPLRTGGGFNSIHTLEGFATFAGPERQGQARGYALIFRNGIVESAAQIGYSNQEKLLIYPSSFESDLIGVAKYYFRNLRALQVEPPFYVSLALLNVRGFQLLASDRDAYGGPSTRSLNRDVLFLPEIFIEEAEPDLHREMKPLFDLIWQVFGHARSFSYNADGTFNKSFGS